MKAFIYSGQGNGYEEAEEYVTKEYECCIDRYDSTNIDEIYNLDKDIYSMGIIIMEDHIGENLELGIKLKEKFEDVHLMYITENREKGLELEDFMSNVMFTSKNGISDMRREKVTDNVKIVFDSKNMKITNKSKNWFIPIKKIAYVECLDKMLYFYGDFDTVSVRCTLKELESILPECFIRCHKSYVINMDWIKCYDTSTITLNNDVNVPIARARKVSVVESIVAYVL